MDGAQVELESTQSDELSEESSDELSELLTGQLEEITPDETVTDKSSAVQADRTESSESEMESVNKDQAGDSETIVSSVEELLDALDLRVVVGEPDRTAPPSARSARPSGRRESGTKARSPGHPWQSCCTGTCLWKML